MSWIYENVVAFLLDLMNGAISFFGEFLNNIYSWMVVAALQNEYVVNAEKFIVVIAVLLVILRVIEITISGYMLETGYDPDADPFNLLIRVAQAIAFIMNGNWIFNWLFKAGNDFCVDLLGAADTTGFSDKTQSLINNANDITGAMGWGIIMTVIVFISLIIFIVLSAKRAADLIAMKLLFAFFATDLVTTSREIWGNFSREYLITFFTYGIQLLFYTIALRSYASASIGDARYYISTIAWLMVAIGTPKFLEKYIYKTGVRNAASGGLRMAAQSYMMRRMFR